MIDNMMHEGMACPMGLFMLIWLALIVWFFIFSILVLKKLGKISDELRKK